MDPVRGLLLEYPLDPYARSSRNSSGFSPQGPRMAPSLPTLSSGQSYYTVESLLGASTLSAPQLAPTASRVPSLETYQFGAGAEPKVDNVPVADRGARAQRAFLEEVISHRRAFPDEAGRFHGGAFDGLHRLAARERGSLLQQELSPRDTSTYSRGRELMGLSSSLDHLLARSSDEVRGPVQWGREPGSSVDPSILAAYSRRDVLLEGNKDYRSSLDFNGSPTRMRRDAMLEKGNGYSALLNVDRSHTGMRRDTEVIKGMQRPNVQKPHQQGEVAGVESYSVGAKPDGEGVGYCSVCRINCFNSKSLNIHLSGKRHKIQVELAEKEKRALDKPKLGEVADGNAEDAATTVNGKKRDKPEDAVTSSISKRAKMTESDVKNVALTNNEGKSEMPEKPKRPFPFCHICKVTCTSQQDLQSHRKGKRHAANLQQKSH